MAAKSIPLVIVSEIDGGKKQYECLLTAAAVEAFETESRRGMPEIIAKWLNPLDPVPPSNTELWLFVWATAQPRSPGWSRQMVRDMVGLRVGNLQTVMECFALCALQAYPQPDEKTTGAASPERPFDDSQKSLAT